MSDLMLPIAHLGLSAVELNAPELQIIIQYARLSWSHCDLIFIVSASFSRWLNTKVWKQEASYNLLERNPDFHRWNNAGPIILFVAF